MQSFDYITSARIIQDELSGEFSEWKTRMDDALAGGSTGTEILMAVRWNLSELLKTNPALPKEMHSRINDYIEAANKLLT